MVLGGTSRGVVVLEGVSVPESFDFDEVVAGTVGREIVADLGGHLVEVDLVAQLGPGFGQDVAVDHRPLPRSNMVPVLLHASHAVDVGDPAGLLR